MKQNINSRTTRVAPPTQGAQPRWRLASALIVLAVGGLAYLHFANGNHSLSTAPVTIVSETKQQETPGRTQGRMPKQEVRTTPAMSHAKPMDPTPASAPPDPIQVRQFVSSLVALDLKSGSISAEQAATWKQNLRQLIGAGTQAVPAIKEFLGRNQDIDLYALP